MEANNFYLHNVCPSCSSKFITPYSLRDHLKNKHGIVLDLESVKEFNHPVKNSKKVKNERAKKRDNPIIREEKMCMKCGRTYRGTNNLNRHLLASTLCRKYHSEMQAGKQVSIASNDEALVEVEEPQNDVVENDDAIQVDESSSQPKGAAQSPRVDERIDSAEEEMPMDISNTDTNACVKSSARKSARSVKGARSARSLKSAAIKSSVDSNPVSAEIRSNTGSAYRRMRTRSMASAKLTDAKNNKSQSAKSQRSITSAVRRNASVKSVRDQKSEAQSQHEAKGKQSAKNPNYEQDESPKLCAANNFSE